MWTAWLKKGEMFYATSGFYRFKVIILFVVCLGVRCCQRFCILFLECSIFVSFWKDFSAATAFSWHNRFTNGFLKRTKERKRTKEKFKCKIWQSHNDNMPQKWKIVDQHADKHIWINLNARVKCETNIRVEVCFKYIEMLKKQLITLLTHHLNTFLAFT